MNPHSENHTTHTLAQNYAQRRTCTMRFLTESPSILLHIYSTSQSFPVVKPEVTWFIMFEWAKSARIQNSVSTFSQEDILSERRTLWRKTMVSVVVYEAVLRSIAIHVMRSVFWNPRPCKECAKLTPFAAQLGAEELKWDDLWKLNYRWRCCRVDEWIKSS